MVRTLMFKGGKLTHLHFLLNIESGEGKYRIHLRRGKQVKHKVSNESIAKKTLHFICFPGIPGLLENWKSKESKGRIPPRLGKPVKHNVFGFFCPILVFNWFS